MAYNQPTYGTNPNARALELAVSIYTAVDAEFWDTRYPLHQWRDVVNEDMIISSINPGATTYGAFTRNRAGAAAFMGNLSSNNIPMVSQSAGMITVPLQNSAVGARISNEDARQWDFGFNSELAQDLGEAMRVACDNLVESSVFFGDKAVGFRGFLNYEGVEIINAVPGASGRTEWEYKTAQEMIKDVQTNAANLWAETRGVFLVNTVYLPMAQYAILANTPFTLGTAGSQAAFGSALNYLKTNNIYTNITGRELEILPIRYLSNAGVGGSSRMVLQERDRRNQGLPFPLPYSVQAPVPEPLGAAFYAEQKHGSYFMRQTLATIYVDGI